MLRPILIFGVIAGVLTAAPLFSFVVFEGAGIGENSQLVGYSIMLAALSLIFVALKTYRDRVQGGVIKFLPAFLMGLGISAVAGVIYVIGWEITLSLTNYAFIEDYSASLLEAARAKGASAAELEAKAAEVAHFAREYRNPLFRLPLTFIEIFPVGLIVSLVSALLLRNSRFLPARAPIAT
jgi:NADH:ubiquinone oxidoreductase subunit K